jgi:hypothetical protein
MIRMNLQTFADEEQDYFLPDDYQEAEEIEEVEEVEEVEESDEEVNIEESEKLKEIEEVPEIHEEVLEVEEDIRDLELKWLDETRKLKDIPKEDLKAYIQKGMDYDRKVNKLNESRGKLERIDELARAYSMTEEQLVDTLFDNLFEQTAESKGLTKEIVKREYELNNPRKQRDQKAIEAFVKEYPTIKSSDIPMEVWEEYKDGNDLIKAYDRHMAKQETTKLKTEIETLKQQLKLKEQVKETKKRSVVKPTTESGKEEAEDDFLKGFLGLE